ncbi:DNA/RNA non-specific endonuclease [Rheinheimera hassiensis]|uniref:DNA/RNA non-specific endonuclease n=1 Tax=Rheinheimera hassiensis TaxID=1193627 RepID=UPI001F05AB85|nr:DNA/RNA non-specific endonuclease [Rheinheimera hassiensis]
MREFWIGLLAASNLVTAQCEPFVIVDNQIYLSVIDCSIRSPAAVIYELSRDSGNAKRHSSYVNDRSLKKMNPQCHPITNHNFRTYQAALKAQGIEEEIDVGHLAMSNHFDSSAADSKIANQFSNLAPQAAKFNRRGGAWYATEMIVECQRDVEPLIVLAGVLDDPSTTERDHLAHIFGQTTADYWWKVIYWQDSMVYKAWIMPNVDAATETELYVGSYDVSIKTLKEALPISLHTIELLIEAGVAQAGREFFSTEVKGSKLMCRGITTDVG